MKVGILLERWTRLSKEQSAPPSLSQHVQSAQKIDNTKKEVEESHPSNHTIPSLGNSIQVEMHRKGLRHTPPHPISPSLTSTAQIPYMAGAGKRVWAGG